MVTSLASIAMQLAPPWETLVWRDGFHGGMADPRRAGHAYLPTPWPIYPPPQSTEMPSRYNYFNGAVNGRFSAPQGHKDLILFTGTVEDHCGQDGLVYLFFKKEDGTWVAWSAYPNPPHEVADGMGEMPEVRIGAPDTKGHFLLVAVHYVPWFQSTWRVLRLDSWILDRMDEDLLVLEQHRSNHGIWIDPDPPFKLTLDAPHTFTVRFRDGSMDPGRHNTGRTLRFRFDGTGHQRIPPYGDTPEDFLEEWFRLPWNVARTLAAAPLLSKLKPLWMAGQAHKVYPSIRATDNGKYSKRHKTGWRVDFDGWGPDGEGPAMCFILSQQKGGFLISGFWQAGH